MARIIDYRRGDIYYIEAGGVCVGSEQKPGRPGVIVSNDLGNKFRPPLCAKTFRLFRKNDLVHSFVLVLITK